MERDLERAIAADVKLLGGQFLKWRGTVRGVPDRILLAPLGVTVFVETKYSGGLSPQQKKMGELFLGTGHRIIVVKTEHDRYALYEHVLQEIRQRILGAGAFDRTRYTAFYNCPFMVNYRKKYQKDR